MKRGLVLAGAAALQLLDDAPALAALVFALRAAPLVLALEADGRGRQHEQRSDVSGAHELLELIVVGDVARAPPAAARTQRHCL